MYFEELALIYTSRCWKDGFSAEKRNSVLCKSIRKMMVLIGILLLVAVILLLRFDLSQQHAERKVAVLKSRLDRSISEPISYYLPSQHYEYK